MKVKETLLAYNALTELSVKDIKSSTSFRLAKVRKTLKSEFETFHEERTKCLKVAGLENMISEQGMLILKSEMAQEEIDKHMGNFEQANKDIKALGEEVSGFKVPDEIVYLADIRTAPSEKFPEGRELDIKPQIFEALDWLILDVEVE